jgi:hypothetical protein
MRQFLMTMTCEARRRARRSRVHGLLLLTAGVASLSLSSGCATTRAAPVAEGPPLTVPQPPPRVVVPPEEEPLAATGTGPDTPLLTSSPRVQPTPPPVRRPATVRDSEPRSEAPVAAATGVVGPTVPAVAEAPRELRPVPSALEPALDEASVRAMIDKVERLLRGVNASKLSAEAKRNYNDAKGYAAQAKEKLKGGNVGFAADAAAKALQLATVLAGR